MGSVSRRFAGFILVLLALVAGASPVQAGTVLPAGASIYWNPQGTSKDGLNPNNWSADAAGNDRSVASYVLNFNGTGPTRNNDCDLLGGSCAGLVSTASYSGAITIYAATTLSIQGPIDLASARWLAIEAQATLQIDDQQRAGSTAANRIVVPIRMQANAQASSIYGVIINYSTYPLSVGALTGDGVDPVGLAVIDVHGAGMIELAGNSTLAAGVMVVDNQPAANGINAPVRISGVTTTPVVLGENAILQVDGQVGDVAVVAGQTTTAAILRGRGRVGAVTFSRLSGGMQQQALVTGGNGFISPIDDDGAPTLLRCQSVNINNLVAGRTSTAGIKVAALSEAGTGYSRLASDGAVGIGGNGYLHVDVGDVVDQLALAGTVPVRLSGIITHPAGQRAGWFMPNNISISTGFRLIAVDRAVRAPVSIGQLMVDAVPDYRSTGIDLVLVDQATLPVATFAATAVNVFAGQAEAAIGVVTLSQAPTTTVVLTFSDNVGVQSSATASDLPDFDVGTQHVLVFEPGETAKSIITRIGEDPSATFNKTFNLTLDAATGATIGSPQSNTVTIVRGTAPLAMTVNAQAITVATTLATPVPIGQPLTVVLRGGQPPYTGVGAGLQFLTGPLEVENGAPKQTISVIAGANSLDPSAFSFADSKGTPATTPTVHFNILPAEVAPVPSPSLPLSLAPTTIYAPLCPSTPEGLANLQSVIGGAAATDVAAYAWDSSAQAYAKLPAQPTGGLTRTHGVFVASRVALAFDFSGTASPMYSEILLRPGWNFIGVPPIDDGGGGPALTVHDLDKFILFPAGSGVSSIDGVARAELIGSAAYYWNGSSYAQVTTLETGKGYWLRNDSTEDLVLVRAPAAASGVARGGQAGAQGGLVRYLGTVTGAVAARAVARSSHRGDPPPPPGGSSSVAATGNACGSGSGIAAFGLLLLAAACHLLLVRRR